MTRMFHPVFGYHVMLSDAKVAKAESEGWEILLSEQKNQNSESVQALNKDDDQPIKRKPGRPRKTQ